MAWRRASWLSAAVGVALLGTGLRLALSLVNRHANDNHAEVASRILYEGRLPLKADCWECFQPKLYHASVAAVGAVSPWIGPDRLVLIGQALNFLAGSATLGLVGWLILRSAARPALRLTAFALFALNPKWIATTSQATNDTFVMLFSSAALVLTVVALRERREGPLWLALGAMLLATASKANAWVVYAAVAAGLLIHRLACGWPSWRPALGFVVLVPVLTLVNPLAQALTNQRRYGAPIVSNTDVVREWPRFAEPQPTRRPGLVSIRDGLLTFKLPDLLRNPRLENAAYPHPPHRTSLWSQVYARAHSIHFDHWPPGWQAADQAIFPLTRAALVLALFPTALVLLGLARGGRAALAWAAARLARGRAPALAPELVLDLAFVGSLAFLALYAVLYRDFGVMKDIFLYPAIAAVPALFLAGADRLEAAPWARRWLLPALLADAALLCACYVTEVLILLERLITRAP